MTTVHLIGRDPARAACGVYVDNVRVTADRADVTCGRCRRTLRLKYP
jgi:hypothetical protein